MERLELSQNLSRAFEEWKNGQPTNLNQVIRFAMSNGIDLTLKIPRSVLDRVAGTRPITRQDAIDFSTGTEGDFLVFDIFSDLNKNVIQHRKRYSLIAEQNFRDGGPSLLIKSGFAGVFGIFHPDEVASLDLK